MWICLFCLWKRLNQENLPPQILYIDGNWTWLANTKNIQSKNELRQHRFKFSVLHTVFGWAFTRTVPQAGGALREALKYMTKVPNEWGERWKWRMWLQNGPPRKGRKLLMSHNSKPSEKEGGKALSHIAFSLHSKYVNVFLSWLFTFLPKVKIIIKPPFGRICFELFSKHQTVANLSFVSGGFKSCFFRFTPWKLEKWSKLIQHVTCLSYDSPLKGSVKPSQKGHKEFAR